MIYITGDIHADISSRKHIFDTLKEEDILIVLGDFGFSWSKREENLWNKNNYKFLTLSVLGNHENFNRIYNDYERVRLFEGECYKLNDRTFYLKNGEMYNILGSKYLCFGGANSIDKDFRVEGVSWWREEIPTREDFERAIENLDKVDCKFDYLLTHTCGKEDNKSIIKYEDFIYDETSIMIDGIEEYIREHEGRYSKHFFGHHHVFRITDNKIALYKEVYCKDREQFYS